MRHQLAGHRFDGQLCDGRTHVDRRVHRRPFVGSLVGAYQHQRARRGGVAVALLQYRGDLVERLVAAHADDEADGLAVSHVAAHRAASSSALTSAVGSNIRGLQRAAMSGWMGTLVSAMRSAGRPRTVSTLAARSRARAEESRARRPLILGGIQPDHAEGVTVALVVQKYGGSSVSNADRIRRVAERIVETKKQGNEVVVVVSAMGDTTDDLLDLAKQVCPSPPPREMDMLLTAGERISNALVAMAIDSLGAQARSFTGSQAGVITTSIHGNAKIIDVTPGRVRSALDEGLIVLVAGFQGVSQDSKDVTTLGRGGSDTTAVALAAALKADVCEIYTDVDGIFTADPRIVSNARRLDTISFEEMLELAACGAKVLMLRCVEYARRYDVPIHVRSSYSDKPGTWVAGSMEDNPMEDAILTGVAHDRSEAKVTIVGIPDVPGYAAQVFRAVADADVNIDMVLQNVSKIEDGKTDITFTCSRECGPRAVEELKSRQAEIGFIKVLYDDHIGKVSLVGAGMRSHPGVTATFCEALAGVGVNIDLISTSEIRISVLIRDTEVDKAVAALHEAFGLGGDEVATVYAGTGR
jgi:aspartate kinase